MQQNFLKTFFASIFILAFLVPSFVPVFAQTNALFPCSGTNISDPNFNNGHPCSFSDVITAVKEFANRIIQIGLLMLPVILAYVGYLFITSSDNPTNRTKAKKIGWNVLEGVAYMMLAWVLVNLILTALVNPAAFTNTGVFKI